MEKKALLRPKASNKTPVSKTYPAALRQYSKGDTKLEYAIISSLRTNNVSTEFLLWFLENAIQQNVFSDQDGFERGKKDGKALLAVEILNLIERLRL